MKINYQIKKYYDVYFEELNRKLIFMLLNLKKQNFQRKTIKTDYI